MHTEIISGLHSCKPGNDPVVGQVKTFVIEQKVGKSGKQYLKIKSAGAEFGGTPHRIVSAERTDFVDPHGNLSFNLEIEPAITGAMLSPQGIPSARIAPTPPLTNLPSRQNDDRSARIERQSAQARAIAYFAMMGDKPNIPELQNMIDWMERDIDQSVKLRPATRELMDGDYAPMRGPEKLPAMDGSDPSRGPVSPDDTDIPW